MNTGEFVNHVRDLADQHGMSLPIIRIETDDVVITAQNHDAGLRLFTDDELRARDESIARAALGWWDFDGSYGCLETLDNHPTDLDEIIDAAEADQ